MEICKAKTKDIVWYTDSIGFVVPFLTLDRLIKTKEIEFDAIRLNPENVKDVLYREGDTLKIEVNGTDVKLSSVDYGSGNELRTTILACPSCSSEIENHICKNSLCYAKSRAQLYRLISLTTDTLLSFTYMDKYLDNFKLTQGGEVIKVNTLDEYLFYLNDIFFTIYTTGRPDQVATLEKKIIEVIVNLGNEDFWIIHNLKYINDRSLQMLGKIDFNFLKDSPDYFEDRLGSIFSGEFGYSQLLSTILISMPNFKRTVGLIQGIKEKWKQLKQN